MNIEYKYDIVWINTSEDDSGVCVFIDMQFFLNKWSQQLSTEYSSVDVIHH